MNYYETSALLDSKLGPERTLPVPVGSIVFDSLRARVEREIPAPAIVAITAPLIEDGRELASRGLASSLAATGYATLLIDTTLGIRSLSTPAPGLGFDDIARQLSAPDPAGTNLAFLALSDAVLQRTTSQRKLQLAFESLRSRFDYVIIGTGPGASSSFATSVLNAADAILVSVTLGRRKQREDAALSRNLENMGSRFLGVIALEPEAINEPSAVTTIPQTVPHVRRSSGVHTDAGLRHREVV